MDLSQYVKAQRGRVSELAQVMQVSASLVTQWAGGTKPVSAERCALVERATGGQVTRRDLRPNDWWLIWPELVTDEHPIPQLAQQA